MRHDATNHAHARGALRAGPHRTVRRSGCAARGQLFCPGARAADRSAGGAIIAQRNENDKEEKNEKESLLTSNEAKNAKYCIKNDSGMLSVYNATASEKYFDTGVYFEELPDEAKNKVTNGLYFFNETDLYDFLESYSS